MVHYFSEGESDKSNRFVTNTLFDFLESFFLSFTNNFCNHKR